MPKVDLEQVMNNIKQIYNTYGKKNITSDKRLLMVYWRDCDGVKIDKSTIDAQSWLNNATSEITIINAKMMIHAIYDSEK